MIGLLAVSAFAVDPHLGDLLKQVENRYNHAKTLQVLFTEEYTPPGSIRRTEGGLLLLRKPGRMRLDYSQPKGKLAVSDGKYLWLYTPDGNRAERAKLDDMEDLRAPLAFLLGKLHFEKEFRDIESHPDGSDIRITAEPKNDNLPYSKVEFVITPENRIREVKVTGFDHSVLDFVFSEEKLDPPLDAKLFQFQPPPGVQVENSEP